MLGVRVVEDLPGLDPTILSILPKDKLMRGMILVYGTKYQNIRIERILSAILTAMAKKLDLLPVKLDRVEAILQQTGCNLILEDSCFLGYLGDIQRTRDIDVVMWFIDDAIYIIPLPSLVATIVASQSARDDTSMDT